MSTFAGHAHIEILIATASGYAGRFKIGEIPYIEARNSDGHKLTQRTNPVIAMPYTANAALYAITTKRILPVKQGITPFNSHDYPLLKLKSGEKPITLFTYHT